MLCFGCDNPSLHIWCEHCIKEYCSGIHTNNKTFRFTFIDILKLKYGDDDKIIINKLKHKRWRKYKSVKTLIKIYS